jgi:phosphomannomutase
MLAAMHVLAALGEQPGSLSALVCGYQRYVASGELNSTVPDAAERTEAVRSAFAADDVVEDRLDGLTLTCEAPDGRLRWSLNLRASNTEPLLRLNVEAVDRATMEQVRDDALALIRA